MGCFRIWCTYQIVCSQSSKSKCRKWLKYLPEGKLAPATGICRSFMFIVAGISSPFRACDRFSVMLKHIYPTAYISSFCRAELFLSLLLSLPLLFNMFCSCSVSLAPLPLVSRDTWGDKARQGSFQVRWDGEVARVRKRSCRDVSLLKEVPQRDHKSLQAQKSGFIHINTKRKTAPLLTSPFSLNQNETEDEQKRVNRDLLSAGCVTVGRGCSLGLVFSSATVAQPPWWPRGSLGKSLLWSPAAGCPSQRRRASAGLPALLSPSHRCQPSCLLLPPPSSSKYSHFFHRPLWKHDIPPFGMQRPGGGTSRPAPCRTACLLWRTATLASVTDKTASPFRQNLWVSYYSGRCFLIRQVIFLDWCLLSVHISAAIKLLK